MAAFLWAWLAATWAITVEAAAWLLAGFLIAGLIHAWVSAARIARHLGKPSFGGVLKAAILGTPLPLCSCSVIPFASLMRRSGASRGATAAFLISTPETGVDSISITYALLGPVMAVLRPVAAVISAVAAGLLVNRFDSARSLRARSASEGSAAEGPSLACASGSETYEELQTPARVSLNQAGCADACCQSVDIVNRTADGATHSPTPRSTMMRLRDALRYGFIDMFADLAVWLAIGFASAGLVAVVMPDGFLQQHVGTGLVAMLVILAIALPGYVCATSSTPIAAALMAKGLSPGTALVFLLVGPATNVATMVVVARELGRRSLVIYLASIVVVAVSLGLLVDMAIVLPVYRTAAQLDVSSHEHSSWWTTAAAVAFVLLIINGVWQRYAARQPIDGAKKAEGFTR